MENTCQFKHGKALVVFCVPEGGIRGTAHDPGYWLLDCTSCAVKYRCNQQQDKDFAYKKLQTIFIIFGNMYK